MPEFADLARFSDIFVILFENVARHSGMDRPRLSIRAAIEGPFLNLWFESEISPDAMNDDASARLAQLRSTIGEGGLHPLMLRAACQLLSAAPSSEEVNALASRLPSTTSTKGFLEALSNHLFFDLLRTPAQRALLSRLAVLTGFFDRRVALSVASVEPQLEISGADWTFISSMVLDGFGEGRCSFPPTLKHVAKQNLAADVSQDKLLISAAMTQLTPRGPTKAVDFLDFQAAIFSLLLAKAHRTAAHYLTLAVPGLYRTVDFEHVRLLFLVLNGDPVHTALEDDFLRWRLLTAEIILRTGDIEAASEPEVAQLFRRMRSIASRQPNRRWFLRFTMLGLLAGIRLKRINPNQPATAKVFAKMAAPVMLAVTIAVKHKAAEQVALFTSFFELSASRLRISDIDLLKNALLLLHATGSRSISANALAELYARFAAVKANYSAKREKLRAQADEFKTVGFAPGYIATMYGVALIEHDRYDNHAGARNIVEGLIETAAQLPRARLLIDRMRVLVADAFWAEKDYANSAKGYAITMKGHHTQGIRGHIQERLIDSLISSREFHQAADRTVSILRRRRAVLSASAKVRLYARLSYAYAESGDLVKAGIASLSLDRIARKSQLEELQSLSLSVAAWVLQHADFSDPLIPRPSIQIRDSSALSDKIGPELLEIWRKEDGLSTKARMQIATVFELHGMFKRSAALFREVLSVAEHHHEYDQSRKPHFERNFN